MRESFADITHTLANIQHAEGAFTHVLNYLRMVRDTAGPNGSRIFFIGNGGSAAIASHMAADYMKNGKFPTMCFNDAAALTCISNDIGYHDVFAMPLRHHARWGDVLIAISSSGESRNILEAVDYAIQSRINVVTLSGFSPTNRLRELGGVNFYVPSSSYGTVEICHLAILHSLLDEMIQNG